MARSNGNHMAFQNKLECFVLQDGTRYFVYDYIKLFQSHPSCLTNLSLGCLVASL